MRDAHLGKLRFKSLQILLLAKELGSLRAVAEAVNTSQPAVTQSLQELEKTFGQTLLTRDYSGVALTNAGEMLVSRAKVAIAEMGAAAETLLHAQSVPILRLGVLPFLMFDLVPSTMRELSETGNPIRLRVHETYVQKLKERLLAGEDDLVLTRLSAAAFDAPEFLSVRIQRIATETVSLFVGQRNPLYQQAKLGKPIEVAQLANCPWVLPPPDTEVRQQVDELLVQNGQAPSIPWIEAASLHSMLITVGETDAVSAGPLSAIQRMAQLLNLAPLNLRKFKFPSTYLVAMHHARQDYNPVITTFLQGLKRGRQSGNKPN